MRVSRWALVASATILTAPALASAQDRAQNTSTAAKDFSPVSPFFTAATAHAASGTLALVGEDGPFRLVIDGDLKPARSERGVTRIEVRRLAPAAQPKPH